MTSSDLTPLVHLAGFTTGIVLYAMLAAMTLRRGAGGRGSEPVNRIPLAAALLGLLWNVGALVIYAFPDYGIGEPPAALVAVAFAALGFLPAFVVDSASRPIASGAQRALVALSYALSAVAGAMHIVGAARGEVPSRNALATLTVGYAVVLILLALSTRRRAGWQRNLSTVVLAAFAVSALHLSHDASQPDSPLVALLGHHASLPLVLVILYQDYRFAFADLFLRRALSLIALVCVAVGLHTWAAVPLVASLDSSGRDGLAGTGVHVALWVATALCYPFVRRGVGRFVDGVILGRRDYRRTRDDVAAAIARADTPEAVLQLAGDVLTSALGARSIQWNVDAGAMPLAHPVVTCPADAREARDTAVVRVPTNDAPRYAIEVTGLTAGRRFLSDDLALLESVASVVGRRIDSVRVTQERFSRGLREREIMQLAAEAELRALRAQLNPHFLFNALTTIGYLMTAAPDRALGTLYRLTDLLRAVLRRPAGDAVSLGDELEIVEAYLAIERERFEERLAVRIDVPEPLRAIPVLPLLVQPLVENAVKHGIAPLRRGGTISISASLDVRGEVPPGRAGVIRITVADTGAGIDHAALGEPVGMGVGLRSIGQRLALHYGTAASLEVNGAPGLGTRAELCLPVAASALPSAVSSTSAVRAVG